MIWLRQDFRLSLVQSAASYSQVLQLRQTAYAQAGKIPASQTATQMADVFDGRSVIVAAQLDGECVGTVLVIVHQDSDILSYGRYFGQWPVHLPPRTAFTEASRLCVHPAHQGQGLAFALAAAMVLVAARFRPYLVSGAVSTLLPLWLRCGFQATGDGYQSSDFGDLPHQLMLMNLAEVLAGKSVTADFQQAMDALQKNLKSLAPSVISHHAGGVLEGSGDMTLVRQNDSRLFQRHSA